MLNQPPHPDSIPCQAVWIADKRLWALGATNSNGNRQGQWTWWKAEGAIFVIENYEDGVLDGSYQRFYNNGIAAITGIYRQGKWQGDVIYNRSDSEANPDMPKVYSSKIRKIVVHYTENGASRAYFFSKYELVDNFARPKPAIVPAAAYWNLAAQQWEWIENQADSDTFITTQWSSETGGKILESLHKNNQLHGWKRTYYKNGELASEVKFIAGEVVDGAHHYYRSLRGEVTLGFSYQESPKIYKKTVVYKDNNSQEVLYFLQNGEACNENGSPVSSIDVSDLFALAPRQFLMQGFEQFLQRIYPDYQKVSEGKSVERKELFAHFYGMPMPDDLSKYFDLMEGAKFPVFFGNLHSNEPPLLQLKKWEDQGKNIAEMAILDMQRFYPFDYWMDWMTGSICLDKQWMKPHSVANYSYSYSLCEEENQHFIYHWNYNNHDNYWGTQPLGAFARDLSSFIYFVAACQSHSPLGVLSNSAFQQHLLRVRPDMQTKLQSYFANAALGIKMGFWWNAEPSLQAINPQMSLRYFLDNRWWMHFLRGQIPLATLKEHLEREVLIADTVQSVMEPQKEAIITNIGYLKQKVSNLAANTQRNFTEQLAYLWTAFWCPDSEQFLADAIAANLQQPSVILRHNALLVQALAAGKNQLGNVHIPTVKKMLAEADNALEN